MMQIIKGQGHLLFALRDLSKAYYTRGGGGICKFKLILSIFGATNGAGYYELHDCNIVMFILSRDICFHGFWHQTYQFFFLFCKPFYLQTFQSHLESLAFFR